MKTIKAKYWSHVPTKYTGKIEWEDEDIYWLKDGKIHRTNDPAMDNKDGSKCWHINGKLHRTNGPAVEYPDGSVEHWINDERVSKEEAELFGWFFPKEE